MVNPGVDSYTKAPDQRKIRKNRKKTTTCWKPFKTEIQGKWGPGFCI